jgi:hypothetical protein
MKEYIQDTSKKAGVDGVTIYGARVQKLWKQDDRWEVTWSTLREDERSEIVQEEEHRSVKRYHVRSALSTRLTVADI